MYKQMLKTWIFCILVFVIIPSLCVCAPSENKTTQNSLYETVVSKCPSLGPTDLYNNWKDVFDNQCSNWTAINAATELTNKELPYVKCKVLYESIMAFCLVNLESLEEGLMLKGFIPTPKGITPDLSEICNDKTGLPALKATPNNISYLMQNLNCPLICSIIGSNGPEVTDICKLAYFFKSFDVKKFQNELMKLHGNITSSPAPQLKNETVKISESVKTIAPKPSNQSVPIHVDSEVPKLPEDNKDNVVKTQESPLVNKSKIDAKPVLKPEEDAPAVHPQLILPNPLENAADAESQNVKSEDNSAPDPDEQNMNIQNNDLGVAVDAGDDVFPPDASDNKDEDKGQGDGPDENGFPAEPEFDFGKAKSTLKQASTKGKPSTLHDDPISNINPVENDMDGDSYFFSYFSVTMCLVIVGYVGYHNRHKILALLLEGKRGKRNGRSGRRPNSANYHKLDTNLEEAISSSCTKNPPSNIIY